MKTHPFDEGKAEATEQIVSLIYNRYMYYRTFYGKDSEITLSYKNLIHSIRDAQAEEMEQDKNK